MGCPNLLDENILQEFLELKSIVGERLAYLIYDKRNSFFRTNEDGLINQEFITRNKSFSSQRDTILSMAIEELENIDSDYIEKIKNSLNETNASDNIKPEVKELFESNPKLANEVYEALGFGQLKEPKVNDIVTLEFYFEKEDKIVPVKVKITELEKFYQGASTIKDNQGNIIKQEKGTLEYFLTLEKLDGGKKYEVSVGEDGYINQFVGGTGKTRVGTNNYIPEFDLSKSQITPQQKQQAQQLYSKYLEQNPNGSVEQFRDWIDSRNNFNKELAQKIQDKLEKLYPEIALNITNNPVWEQGDNVMNQQSTIDAEVQYRLKAVDILLSDKAKQVFAKGEKNKWSLDKILTELAIPKEQKKLLLDLGIHSRENLALELASRYGYNVEINTAKDASISSQYVERDGHYFRIDALYGEDVEISKDNYDINKEKDNTQHYSNLTVPGGTNYTENEISTPLITPSIKGHAKFSTDKGIGWFRSDDRDSKGKLKGLQKTLSQLKEDRNNPFDIGQDSNIDGIIQTLEKQIEKESKNNFDNTKTRRILEVQSDLFQKGRDSKRLITVPQYNQLMEVKQNYEGFDGFSVVDMKDGEVISIYNTREEAQNDLDRRSKLKPVPELTNEEIKENQFLQLLNKSSNWVTFFVKSIIQDSAKKGYEKVLFPKGETAAKIEGHQTLEEFKKQKEDRIKELETSSILKNKTVDGFYYIQRYLEDENGDEVLTWRKVSNETGREKTATVEEIAQLKERFSDETKNEINQLKQELERVEGPEGFGALKPIYNFYENIVANILKKQGYNAVEITDEYGNTWNEISINQARDLSNILLQRNEANQIIGQANIKAMTVLVDAVNQKQDTLPHEYAHHYIAWFRNTPIVQEAIKKWGSEEALVQSIGEQVVKQKGEAFNWWNNFVKWIMNQFNSLSKLQKEELTQILTDAFLTRRDLNNIESNSFQQFQESLNKPNTNPILQGNQQEQILQRNEVNDLIPNTPEQLEIDFGQDYIGKNIKKTHNLFLEDKGSITTEEYEKLPYKDNGLTKTFYANSESDADYWVAKYGAIKVKLFGKDVGKYKMVIKKPFEIDDLPSSVEKLPKEIEEAINRKKNVIQALKLKISKDNSRSNELKSKINLLNSRINKIKEKYKSDDFKLYEIAYEDVKLISENLKSFEKTLEGSNLTSNELRIIADKLIEVSYDIKGWIDVHNLVSEKYFGTEMDIANITGAIKMLDSKYKKILTNVFVRFAKLNTIYTELSEEDLSKAVADISIYDANVHTIGKSDIKLLKIVDDLLNNTATDINLEYQNKKTIINNQLKKAIDKLKISRNDLKEFFKQKRSDGTWTGNIIGEFKQEFYDKQSELIEEAKESKNWGKYFKWLNKNSKSFTSKELVEISKMDEESITKIGRFSEKEVLKQKKLINDYRSFYMASVELLGKLDKYIDGELIINENESNEGISVEFKHDDAKIVDNFYYEIDSIIKENSPFEYLSNKEKKVNSKIKNVGYYYIIRNKPNENWEDPKFKEIKENETLMETYNMIMDTLNENNKYLPILDEYQSNYMPELAKPLLQRISNNGLIGMFGGLKNEIINSITEEINNSEEIRPIIGSQSLSPIPIKMMSNNIITENKEDDIFKVLIEHSKMAISYKYKSQIEPLANASLDLIDAINEVSIKTTKAGSEYVTKFGKIKEREGGLVNAKKALKFRIESFLNNKSKDIEGVTKTKKKVKNLSGEIIEKNISLSKILDFLLGVTYAKQLGAPNVISPTVNLAYGLVSNLSYAAGGVYVSEKNLIKSFMDLHSIAIGVNSKSEKTEKILTFIDSFGIFGNLYDTEVADNGFIQKITFLQQKAELINQGSLVLAILKTIKLKDKNGNDISIYDAYTIDNGHLKWDTTKMEAQELLGNDVVYNKEKTQVNFKTLSSFINEIVEEVHGDYKNPMMIKKTVLMRAVMQYKRFIPNSVKHRFGKEYENMNLIDEKTGKRGVLVKGRYLSYINSKIFDEKLNQYVDAKFGDIVKILISGLLFNKKNIQQLKEIDRINMMRNIRELHFILLSMAAIMALESLINDDDDDDFMVKILINSISKTQADMMFFLNPSAMSQMTNNFIPVLSTIEDMKNLMYSSFKMLYGDIYYENGPWKDYSRLGVSAMRLFPGTNGAVKMWNYGSQVFEFN